MTNPNRTAVKTIENDAIAADPIRRLALEIAEAYRTEADLSTIIGLVRRLTNLDDCGGS